VAYHSNGKMKEQGEYIGDKKYKEWKTFDENGSPLSSVVYKAGVPVKN